MKKNLQQRIFERTGIRILNDGSGRGVTDAMRAHFTPIPGKKTGLPTGVLVGGAVVAGLVVAVGIGGIAYAVSGSS